jgi:hypothetical protein
MHQHLKDFTLQDSPTQDHVGANRIRPLPNPLTFIRALKKKIPYKCMILPIAKTETVKSKIDNTYYFLTSPST